MIKSLIAPLPENSLIAPGDSCHTLVNMIGSEQVGFPESNMNAWDIDGMDIERQVEVTWGQKGGLGKSKNFMLSNGNVGRS